MNVNQTRVRRPDALDERPPLGIVLLRQRLCQIHTTINGEVISNVVLEYPPHTPLKSTCRPDTNRKCSAARVCMHISLTYSAFQHGRGYSIFRGSAPSSRLIQDDKNHNEDTVSGEVRSVGQGRVQHLHNFNQDNKSVNTHIFLAPDELPREQLFTFLHTPRARFSNEPG